MAVTPADQDEAFLREVDENLRADQLADFGRRYGKLVIGAVVGGLVILAAVLFWQYRQATKAGAQGEQLQSAFEKVATADYKGADAQLAELAKSDIDGYRVAGLMSQAAVLVEQGNTKAAAAKFAAVAGDSGLAGPYRDLALVKQTMLEFDDLAPQTVIDRLKPLTVKESAFYGTAGEMTGLALIRLNRRKEAGELFAAMSRADGVPATIRQRAVQMAGVLGVDAVDQGEVGQGEGGSRK